MDVYDCSLPTYFISLLLLLFYFLLIKHTYTYVKTTYILLPFYTNT